MFLYDKDMERVMQHKKREILKELEETKCRILKELSGVDKVTLTRLREIIADYNRIDFNINNKMENFISRGEIVVDDVEKFAKLFEAEIKQLDNLSNGLRTLNSDLKTVEGEKVSNGEFNEVIAELENSIANLNTTKANKTDLTTPFNFKGSTMFADLPTTNNNVNDTYYCTDLKTRYTWNGSEWFQSSLDETGYTDELSKLSEDIVKIGNEIEYLKDFKETIPPKCTVYENSYYDKVNCDIIELEGFVRVDIDVTNVEGVKLYGYQGIAMVGICFVDEEGNLLPTDDGDIFHIPSVGGYRTLEFKKPNGSVMAKTCFSVSQDREYYIETFNYAKSPFDNIDIKNLSNVTMIPIFGQSLSIGSASSPIISTSQKYDGGVMFNGGIIAQKKDTSFFTNIIPLNETTGKNVETVASGCLDKIIEQIQSDYGVSAFCDYWNNHNILFVSCGEGSKTIEALKSDYLQGLKNAIQGAKNICNSKGLTLNVPCWIWIQGETDQKEGESTSKPETTATDKETYKSSLVELQTILNEYCKSVTGQSNDIKCVCYQTVSQNIVSSVRVPKYNNANVMGVPTAQMELVRDNEYFVSSSPAYVLTHSTTEPIHLTAEGEKMLGLYCGLASKSIIFGEKSPTGLTPQSYLIKGNTLEIKYNVPTLPLRIDTTWVKEVENYGFTLLNSNDENIISGVSVFDDTVIIECSASPLNAMLFYGFNGTEWKDGRKEGSRGNLCDSAQFIFNGEIGGKRYALSNYAYSFVKLLRSESGTI